MNKLSFAELIGYISAITGKQIAAHEISEINDIVNNGVEKVEPVQLPAPFGAVELDGLMSLFHAGTHKIEAIKLHRQMTGYGLKESKDWVEKYWPEKVPDTKAIVANYNKLLDFTNGLAGYSGIALDWYGAFKEFQNKAKKMLDSLS